MEIVELFCSLVRIDSESGDEGRFIADLAGLLEEELEAETETDSYGNLIGRVEAKGSSAEPVLLAAHADTVKPGKGIRPVIEDGVIRSEGETILGADDKAGIAEIIAAIKEAKRHPPVEIVITRGEEVGLLGARNLDLGRISSKRAFIIDGERLDQVIIGGPTHISFDATITGRAAHAGMEPEKGISAIRVAAKAICREVKEDLIDSVSGLKQSLDQEDEHPDSHDSPKYSDFDEMLEDYDKNKGKQDEEPVSFKDKDTAHETEGVSTEKNRDE